MQIAQRLSICLTIAVFLVTSGSLRAQIPRHQHRRGDRPLPDLRLHEHAFHEPVGSRLFRNSMCTQNRCCLPCYDYGHDDPRHTARVLAQSLPIDETQVTWLTAAAPDRERSVRRKKFHFPASNLTVDHIQLDQVGLALFNTGRLDASGMVFHSGGPFGNVLGNRVILRVQAFAGPNAKGVPFADAPLVWQWEYCFWARRGRRQVVNFAPAAAQPDLRLRFHEITHLAVELEYIHDR